TTFTDHGGDDWGFQACHDSQVPGNRFALVALFSIDARVSAWRIDERQDWHLEAFSHFHQAARLAVALRARHAEVAANLLAHFTAFLVTDDHHRLVVQTGNAAHDGRVVGKVTVAVQFVELGEDVLD